MVSTTDDLLDLTPGIGQRASTFRFQLVDRVGSILGEIHPDADRNPSIENNTSRGIKRDLRNLYVPPDELTAINPIRDWLRVSMVLENGVELPWGTFLFVDGSTAPSTSGTWFSGSLFDQCFILDQPIETSIGYQTNQSISAAISDLFDGAGIADPFVDSFTTTVGRPVVWPAGTSRLKVMNDLAALAGCYSVFFDNAGQGRVELVPDLATANPDRVYTYGGNVYDGSVLATDNLLHAPNRYIVIDSSATSSPVVGSYNVPASAPHSAANRGFVVTQVITDQGLTSTTSANAAAAAAAAQDTADFSWVSFSSAPDARHDTFDVVSLFGVSFRELRWSCPLIEGGTMAHDLRRIYEDEPLFTVDYFTWDDDVLGIWDLFDWGF